MLEYDNFKELICNELQRSLDREDFFVELKISDADNTINKKKDKLSVVDPARPDAFPIFYLNDIYKYYNECGDMYITVDKYNYIVNNIVNSVETIDNAGCFDDIRLVDRDNKVIYPDDTGRKVASVMEEKVNVNRWNEMYKDIAEKFLDTKIDLLQSRRKRKGR